MAKHSPGGIKNKEEQCMLGVGGLVTLSAKQEARLSAEHWQLCGRSSEL